MNQIAIYYDQSGYVETTAVSTQRAEQGPAGLMGREVAGHQFLDALLQHGTWDELAAVVSGEKARRSLTQSCQNHPSSQGRTRRLRFFDAVRFPDQFLPTPPAPVLHFPNPADPAYAWARQTCPHRVAFSGVTHTLCTPRAVDVIRRLVTDPWEPYDRLICTSSAVVNMVQSVTNNYAEFLRDRFGGQPQARIGLEQIPLGVNVDRFRPATTEERTAQRRQREIVDDELVVLFVGRLSHHAKAHPFPLLRAVQMAATRTSQRLRLLMCGWFSSEPVANAFQDAVRAVCPGVRVDFVDGLSAENRSGVWKAADVFVSLVDNIQETFGLVIVEAMASGLPVVASDWNGYRDLVVPGETGFLIPTYAPSDAMPNLTLQLLTGEINYDHFLARSTQAVTVDCTAAANALTELCQDAALRRRMGEAGRRRVLQTFDWQHVIRRYEAMWQEQDRQRNEYSSAATATSFVVPAAYPPIRHTFAGYPTRWLAEHERVWSRPDSGRRLGDMLSLPLMTHEPETRVTDQATLAAALQLAESGPTIKALAQWLTGQGSSRQAASNSIAWLLKYDLLHLADESGE
ncbi:MAG: glycosyltransferase family 4 protein [Planctomycetaceae bacterium]|nr:glycosyltransferase family 4 protein [Planctomycetaceae bacterium]